MALEMSSDSMSSPETKILDRKGEHAGQGIPTYRPHVTREKAVSCQITFKLYCFFSQFVANSSKASLSCYIYWDLRQLMVILRIVYVIYCDFAIVCDIYCDLWQFCNNFKFFS